MTEYEVSCWCQTQCSMVWVGVVGMVWWALCQTQCEGMQFTGSNMDTEDYAQTNIFKFIDLRIECYSSVFGF